jgi:acetyltransferase-like isoleucine patch superfamily enzyme
MSQPILSFLKLRLRPALLKIRRYYLIRVWGIDIGKDCEISFTAKLDKTYPRGVHIGDYTIVTFGAVVLSHDGANDVRLDTWIGKNCFIGARSIILPGVEVGDNSIVGAGSVVVKNVPPHSIVAGNPARVIKSEIETGPYGVRPRMTE